MLNTTTQQIYYIKTYAGSNITFEFTNVSLPMETTFSIYGLNILMYQTELLDGIIYVYRLDKQSDTGVINITNSTFGYMDISDGFDIILSDCYIDNTSGYPIFLNLVSSCNHLSIKRSTLYNFGHKVMYAANCKIEMQDVSFIDSYGGYFEEFSTIHMDNVYLYNTFISLVAHSSLHIDHSRLEGQTGLALKNNCNLTLTNVTVKQTGNFEFMNAYRKIQINITNCTFSDITALLAAKGSHVLIDNSSIRNSQSLKETDTKHFINISLNSHLIIHDTNITNNEPAQIKTFFSGRLNSHLEMYRSRYAGNSFSTHFITDENSDVTIKGSQFINNNSTTGIFDLTRNKLIIEGCLFKGNEGTNIAKVLSSSNVSITNCVFLNTNRVVLMESDVMEMKNNYLEIDKCTFDGCRDDLFWVKNVPEISIQKSYFRCSALTELNNYMFIIEGARTVKIASSEFIKFSRGQRTRRWHMLYFENLDQDINVYTFQSTFTADNGLITSNETNFLHKAQVMKVIIVRSDIILEETAFASSKWSKNCKIKVNLVYLVDLHPVNSTTSRLRCPNRSNKVTRRIPVTG